jgi:hypothetical protein
VREVSIQAVIFLLRQCIGKAWLKVGGTLYKVPAAYLTISTSHDAYVETLKREEARSRLYHARQRAGLKALKCGRRYYRFPPPPSPFA